MASNQTNSFQSLDSSVEEFTDGQENENTKKKTKHDFLFWKAGWDQQTDELTSQELLITFLKEHSSLALSAIWRKETVDFALWKTSSSSKLGKRFSQSKGI